MTSFVDTRLYVTVRPCLEYLIPDTGACVVRFLLGEVSMDEVNESMEKCLVEPCDRLPPLHDHNEVSRQITQLSCVTCSHVQEYLSLLSHVWVQFAQQIQSDMKAMLKELEVKRVEANNVYEKYKAKNPTIVEEEYKKEMLSLERDLNTNIERLRSKTCPAVTRTKELEHSSNELKEAFAESYGELATKKLISLKQTFESELQATQSEVAFAFVKSMKKICDM